MNKKSALILLVLYVISYSALLFHTACENGAIEKCRFMDCGNQHAGRNGAELDNQGCTNPEHHHDDPFNLNHYCYLCNILRTAGAGSALADNSGVCRGDFSFIIPQDSVIPQCLMESRKPSRSPPVLL